MLIEFWKCASIHHFFAGESPIPKSDFGLFSTGKKPLTNIVKVMYTSAGFIDGLLAHKRQHQNSQGFFILRATFFDHSDLLLMLVRGRRPIKPFDSLNNSMSRGYLNSSQLAHRCLMVKIQCIILLVVC